MLYEVITPHTDILKKARRETEYGHKITLGCGASGIITDVVIEDGNPADANRALPMVQRHKEIYGKMPREVAFDGGYASKANLKAIKEEGVKHVCFHKKSVITSYSIHYTKLYDEHEHVPGERVEAPVILHDRQQSVVLLAHVGGRNNFV